MTIFTVEHHHYVHDCKTESKLDEVLARLDRLQTDIANLKIDSKKLDQLEAALDKSGKGLDAIIKENKPI